MYGLAERGGHLVGERAGDDHAVGLARGGAEDDAEPVEVVAGGARVHHLHGAAGEPERHGPDRAPARPVHQVVHLGDHELRRLGVRGRRGAPPYGAATRSHPRPPPPPWRKSRRAARRGPPAAPRGGGAPWVVVGERGFDESESPGRRRGRRGEGGEGEESGAGTRLHTAVLLETRKLTGLVGSRLCHVAEYRWT